MTENKVNASTATQEKLQCETLDYLTALARMLKAKVSASRLFFCYGLSDVCSSQAELSFFKADIDSAFRRVPIAPEHRDMAYVAFKLNGKLQLFGHNAMPFGAIASVHAWDRVGKMCDIGIHC